MRADAATGLDARCCFVCCGDASDAPLLTGVCGCRDRAVHAACLARTRAACATHARGCPVCTSAYLVSVAASSQGTTTTRPWSVRRLHLRSDWLCDVLGLLSVAYVVLGLWLMLTGRTRGWDGLLVSLFMWCHALSTGGACMWVCVLRHRTDGGWCCLRCPPPSASEGDAASVPPTASRVVHVALARV